MFLNRESLVRLDSDIDLMQIIGNAFFWATTVFWPNLKQSGK